MNELALVIPDERLAGPADRHRQPGRPGRGRPPTSRSATSRQARRSSWSAAPSGQDAVAGFIAALEDIDGVTRVGVAVFRDDVEDDPSETGSEATAVSGDSAAGERTTTAAPGSSSPSSRSSSPSTRSRSRRPRPPRPASRPRPRRPPAAPAVARLERIARQLGRVPGSDAPRPRSREAEDEVERQDDRRRRRGPAAHGRLLLHGARPEAPGAPRSSARRSPRSRARSSSRSRSPPSPRRRARSSRRYYGRLVVLGKAVPERADTASMLVQLNSISNADDVNWSSITLDRARPGPVRPRRAPPPPAGGRRAASTATPAAAPRAQLPPTARPPPPAPRAAPQPPARRRVPAAAPSPPRRPRPRRPPPACRSAPRSAPPACRSSPTTSSFQGGFFDVADFIGGLDELVKLREESGQVVGRRAPDDDRRLRPLARAGTRLRSHPDRDVLPSPPTRPRPTQGLTAGASPGGPAPPPPAAPTTPASSVTP